MNLMYFVIVSTRVAGSRAVAGEGGQGARPVTTCPPECSIPTPLYLTPDGGDDAPAEVECRVKPTLQEFEFQIQKYEGLANEINTLPTSISFGWMRLDATPLRSELHNLARGRGGGGGASRE